MAENNSQTSGEVAKNGDQAAGPITQTCGCSYSILGNIFNPTRKKRKSRIRKQALPYGISKYVVIFMGCISISLTSSLYYNWTIFEEMFMKEGTLADLCTERERMIAKPGTFVCDAQRRQISNLYTTIMYTDSFIGFVGGYIGDYFGAFYGLAIGQVCGVVAFIMFYFFSKSFVMLYVTFFVWAISCSFALAPTWHYSRMFSFGNNMAVSVITSADNLSMYTPTLFQRIIKRYKIGFGGTCLTYIFWACFTSLAITMFFIPKRFIVEDVEEDAEEQDLASMFNESLGKALADPRFWLSVACYVLQCSVRLFYRRSFTLLFFDNEEVIEFLEEASDLSFVGSFVLGYLNECWGVVTMMCVSTFMYMFALVAVYFRNFTCAYTSALLFAIAQAGDIQQLITFIDEKFPEHESSLMGIANIVNSVAGVSLQIIFNYIFDHLGARLTVFLMILILFGVLVICLFIEAEIWGTDSEKGKSQTEESQAISSPSSDSSSSSSSESESQLAAQNSCTDEADQPADEEEYDYNPSGPNLLLSNIFSAFFNLPYYACLCMSVGIHNIGEYDATTQPREIEDRVVRKLERDQFAFSCDRIVELCGTVFSTSLILLLGCLFEISQRSTLMRDGNAFLLLMCCLTGASAAAILLPFTQMFQVFPPLVAMALTSLPPIALLIFSYVKINETAMFPIMCGIVAAYGVVLFLAGNALLYLNSLMGARFGTLIHGLLGWSNLGMGYLYALILMFAAQIVYKGDSIIGCYMIIMPMQSGLCLFATFVLYLHLSHERQYFYCKKSNTTSDKPETTGKQCVTPVKPTCSSTTSGSQPLATPAPEKKWNTDLRLMFRSYYSTTFNDGLNTDYGLFYSNYQTKGIIRLSVAMTFLAISAAITIADVAFVFLMPRSFVVSCITVVIYFCVRMLFMFLYTDVNDTINQNSIVPVWLLWLLYSVACIFLLVMNTLQLLSIVGTIEEKSLTLFCVCFGFRLLLNALLQHHLLSYLERFNDKGSSEDKHCHAHNIVLYMNLGYCVGLLLFTLLCYLHM
ncbi:hypothetical protein X943_003574 [Babesia divergens]|uniref:Uncharacterized protein n=1 Tax=Babesia divergens TaxID=32595 RepID=A0AAD9LMH3_BABDI|nr:hypothetical protein X943_003574 [Babesia divergens]